MQPLKSSLESSSNQTFAKRFEEHKAMIAAMSDTEREQYFKDAEDRRRIQDRKDALKILRSTANGRMKRSGIPERFIDETIDRHKREVQVYAKAIKNGGKESLIIRGEVGVGKTAAGCAILNYLVGTMPVRFVTMHRFMMLMNDVYIDHDRSRHEVFDEFADIPVLMIDDLGKELTGRNVENVVVQLFNLIDVRSRERRPTIITTQYDSFGIGKLLTSKDGGTANADAIVDRLKYYNLCVIGGASRRQQERIDFDLEDQQ